MMKTYKIYPGGNPTLLLSNEEGFIQSSEYTKLSREVLSSQTEIEQVGFIERDADGQYSVEMMGGEVSVNGIRSLAMWDYLENGTQKSLYGSSGTDARFECSVETWVSINIPKRFVKTELFPWCFVKLDGIAYFVAEGCFEQKRAEEELRELCEKYKELVRDIPAVGLVLIEDEKKVWPLISVPGVGSMVLETACGTGTLAAYITMKKQRKAFIQPSGEWYVVDDSPNMFVIKSMVSLQKESSDQEDLSQNPVLKSERLLLRRSRREDVPDLFELIKEDWELTKYMLWDPPSEISQTYEAFEKENKENFNFLVFEGGNLVGRVCLRKIDFNQRSANLGYWVGSKFQGKGFGTEMLKLVCKFGFESLGLDRITAEVSVENLSSQRVLEKNGFKRVKFLKENYIKNGVSFDEYLFELQSN